MGNGEVEALVRDGWVRGWRGYKLEYRGEIDTGQHVLSPGYPHAFLLHRRCDYLLVWVMDQDRLGQIRSD